MGVLQLDFFEKDELTLLKMEVEANKRSTDKVRKGTYARINVLEKDLADLRERLGLLEAHICTGGKLESTRTSQEKHQESWRTHAYDNAHS